MIANGNPSPQGTSETSTALRQQAVKIRRIAREMTWVEDRKRLNEYADELETEAAAHAEMERHQEIVGQPAAGVAPGV